MIYLQSVFVYFCELENLAWSWQDYFLADANESPVNASAAHSRRQECLAKVKYDPLFNKNPRT
jgi:hypothetical protein